MDKDYGGSGPTIGPERTGLEPDVDERMWAMFCHLSAFAGYLLVVPFASILGPLVIWLLKKEQMPFVDEHGKEAINFQITMSIAYAISLVLWLVIIGIFITGFLAIWNVVLIIIAMIKANSGEYFRYPLTLRLVR